MKADCNKKGYQQSNLTNEQFRGLQKLKKRVQQGEIVIYATDKTNRLAITTCNLYLKMGLEHTSKDEEVNQEDITKCQSIINGHTSMFLKLTGAGENWDHSSMWMTVTVGRNGSTGWTSTTSRLERSGKS